MGKEKFQTLFFVTPVIFFGSVLIYSCASSGDPSANRGYASGNKETTYVAATDGEVSVRALGKVARFIRTSRKLAKSEEQIFRELARKEIDGYRAGRLKVLEEKKKAVKKRIVSSRKNLARRVDTIKKSSGSAGNKASQISSAKTAQKAEETSLNKQLVLIEQEIQLEKSKSYILPVKEKGQPSGRSVVIVEASMKIRDSKIYRIDRDITDLAKVVSPNESITVLSNATPLNAN